LGRDLALDFTAGKVARCLEMGKVFFRFFLGSGGAASKIGGMSIAENFAEVQKRIQEACARAGREASSVLLLPVTKGHSVEMIEEAAGLGVRIFGENKVQEAKGKIPQCSARLQWHMIGHLQSNKARDAVQLFSMIQSVDSLSLAEEVNKWAEKLSKRVPILVEVNTGGEGSKYGFKPENIPIEEINALPRLEVQGLMTVAPYTATPERVRPYFRRLRELWDECNDRLGAPLPHLSMGMSGDFEIGIEEGATIVRVGTALFGPRSYSKTASRKEAD
jgi:pyridoxal phosphate enzyme (YggS family)